MSGNVQRIWPTVQSLGRTLVCKSEFLQQGVKAYSHHSNQNVNVGFNNGYFNHTSTGQLFSRDSSFINKSIVKTSRGRYMKVVSRTFSYGTYMYFREFADEENEHAYNILKSIPEYNANTVRKDSDIQIGLSDLTPYQILNEHDWESSNPSEMTQAFLEISNLSSFYSLNIDDKMFNYFCTSLLKKIDNFEDEQIIDILYYVSKLIPPQFSDGLNFDNLCNALDDMCSKMVRRSANDRLFILLDHLYMLGICQNLMCYEKIINRLSERINSFNHHQIVQFIFFANIKRHLGYVDMNKLERKILKSLNLISIEELGIISMGLFKTQTCIFSDDLIEEITKKMIENVKIISNHSLGSILKLLRISFKPTSASECYQLLNDLCPHIERFNNLALLQVALLGNNLLVYHSEVLDIIGHKFAKDLENIRLKDLERFSYILMLYKFVPSSCQQIFNLIIEELRDPRRVVEINHFPKCFISCVNYLVTAGHFPHDLISSVFQPSMLQLLQPNEFSTLGRELNELDWSLKIECPSYYVGYRLTPQISSQLTQKFSGRIPCKRMKDLTHFERMVVEIHEKLAMILEGYHSHQTTFVLPHFNTPDIVFCTDKDGNPVTIPKEYKDLPPYSPKYPCGLQSGLRWNVLMIGGRNSFIRDTKELRGNFEMKKRQLQKLGYNVNVVSHRLYGKRSKKYKLLCLEYVLRESSLNLEGRISKLLGELNLEKNENQDSVEDAKQAVSL